MVLMIISVTLGFAEPEMGFECNTGWLEVILLVVIDGHSYNVGCVDSLGTVVMITSLRWYVPPIRSEQDLEKNVTI